MDDIDRALMAAVALASLLLPPVLAGEPSKPNWAQLPPLPDREGFAGAFAGVSDGVLIVGGGANILEPRWQNPLVKKWYDDAFVLESPEGPWRSGFKLPRALGYGVSVSVDDGLICIGGSDADRHYPDVYRVEWRGRSLKTTPLPSLPKPCANACGALVGRTIYVAGGIETPASTTAMKTFWALDLDADVPKWQELEPWPGPERMFAVAGAAKDAFFLFSGSQLSAGPDGKPVRKFLKDAFRFTPGKGWTRLADMPRAAEAAPSPAFGDSLIQMIFSGNDGSAVDFTPIENHPGFPRTGLMYVVKDDTWKEFPNAPFSRATMSTTIWKDHMVFPSGEARPRVRSPEVWWYAPSGYVAPRSEGRRAP